MCVRSNMIDLVAEHGGCRRVAELASKKIGLPVSADCIQRLKRGATREPRSEKLLWALADLNGQYPHEFVAPCLPSAGCTYCGDMLNRRELLTSGVATAGLVAIGPVLAGLASPPDPEVFTREAWELWRSADGTADPAGLAVAAHEHAVRGEALLDRARGGDRRTIAEATLLTSILVLRLTFFDLGRPDIAEQTFLATVSLSRREGVEPANRPLAACLWGHGAFIPGWSGQWGQAEQRLGEAARQARRGGSPALRAWLRDTCAELLVKAGQVPQALTEVSRAEELIEPPSSDKTESFLDYFSPEAHAGFKASVYLAHAESVVLEDPTRTTAHKRAEATKHLDQALALLAPAASPEPQRNITLLDLAKGHDLRGEHDEAVELARQACIGLAARPYRVSAGRIADLHQVLPASHSAQLTEIERSYGLAV